MADRVPREVAELLEAKSPAVRDAAWSAFLHRYHKYLTGTTRYLSNDYDGAMDRYRFVLEELRKGEFRRLRNYVARPTSRFSTWLVVVVRRLCRDYDRRMYGRLRSSEQSRPAEARAVRRRLLDLVAEELDPARMPDRSAGNPDQTLRETELIGALRSALLELDPEDRLLLKLRFEDDLPVSEIVRVMRLPSVFHVYRRLKPALRELQEQLRARGFDDPVP